MRNLRTSQHSHTHSTTNTFTSPNIEEIWNKVIKSNYSNNNNDNGNKIFYCQALRLKVFQLHRGIYRNVIDITNKQINKHTDAQLREHSTRNHFVFIERTLVSFCAKFLFFPFIQFFTPVINPLFVTIGWFHFFSAQILVRHLMWLLLMFDYY